MACPGNRKARTKLKSFLIELDGQLRCLNCDLPLKSKYDLFDHFKNAHPELCCNDCELFFADDAQFRNHLHYARKDCSCTDCFSRMVAGIERKRLKKIQREKIFARSAAEQSCPYCNEVFQSRKFLQHLGRAQCKASTHTAEDFEEAFRNYVNFCPGDLFTFAYRPDGGLGCNIRSKHFESIKDAVEHVFLRSWRCLGREAITDLVHFFANNSIGADFKASRFVCLHTAAEKIPVVKDVKHGRKLGGSKPLNPDSKGSSSNHDRGRGGGKGKKSRLMMDEMENFEALTRK